MKRKDLIVVALLIAGVFALSPKAFRSYREQREAAKLEKALIELASQNPVIRPGTGMEPLPGTQDRRELFAMKSAYDRLELRDGLNAENLAALTELSHGLKSTNEMTRETTAEMVRYILTGWVLRTSPENWRQSSDLNAFFRFYKQNGARSLARYLEVHPSGPEAQYLKSI